MSFDYIKRTYGVDAHRGQPVIAFGKPGVITGADGQYLRIRLVGEQHSNNYHPTEGIEYVADAAQACYVGALLEAINLLEIIRDADEDCRRDGLHKMPAHMRSRIDAVLIKVGRGPLVRAQGSV